MTNTQTVSEQSLLCNAWILYKAHWMFFIFHSYSSRSSSLHNGTVNNHISPSNVQILLLLLLLPFNGLFSRTTWVSRYQKGKNNLDFTGARDSELQWHQLGRMQVCTSLQTDNHTSTPPLCFLQAGCPSCRPTNSIKALTNIEKYHKKYLTHPSSWYIQNASSIWERFHSKQYKWQAQTQKLWG